MLGIPQADKCRTATAALHIALVEGGRIGKPPVIEDVVDVEALDARLQSVELHTVHGTGVYIAAIQFQPFDLVVITGLAVEHVDAELRTVQAEIKLLLVVAAEMAQVESITEKDPPPAEVRSEFHRGLRRKVDVEIVIGVDIVDFVGIGVLHHEREVVLWRLHIQGVHPAEVLHKLIKAMQQTLAETLLLFFCTAGSSEAVSISESGTTVHTVLSSTATGLTSCACSNAEADKRKRSDRTVFFIGVFCVGTDNRQVRVCPICGPSPS